MAQLNNVKLALRIDDLSNWNTYGGILRNGEVALIRNANSSIKIKIGDGESKLSSLDYVNELEFFT